MMSQEYKEFDKIETEALFKEMLQEIEERINRFEKTLGYKQLTYMEQQGSRDIIRYFGEFMFDYHLQTLSNWDERAMQEVLLSVFPYKIVANLSFFEMIAPVLNQFFLYLYYQESVTEGLSLSEGLACYHPLMLEEVEKVLKDSVEEEILLLGEELGLDMSNMKEIDSLYQLMEWFELSRSIEGKGNIVEFAQTARI